MNNSLNQEKREKKFNWVQFGAATFFFLVMFGLETIFREKLFQYSANQFANNVIMKTRSSIVTYFFLAITNIVNPSGDAVILIVCLLLAKNKFKMLNFLYFVTCAIFFITCLKALYHCPRPYWVNK